MNDKSSKKRFETFSRRDVVRNCDRIARLESFKGWDVDAIETGLTRSYFEYAVQGKRHEFFAYLKVIENLDEENIPKLSPPQKQVRVWFDTEDSIDLTWESLSEFVKKINDNNLKQPASFYWDDTVSFICTTDQLEDKLKQAHIADGQFMEVRTGNHTFGIQKLERGFYVFGINNIQNDLLPSEEAVAQKINEELFLLPFNENVALTVKFLSYRKPSQLDTALDDFFTAVADRAEKENTKESLNLFQPLMSLRLQYKSGLVSRFELAHALRLKIFEITNQIIQGPQKDFSSKYIEMLALFDEALRSYLGPHAVSPHHYFDDLSIDGTAYESSISLLHLAIQSNQITLVRALLDAGADPNLQTEEGYSGFYMACLNGHTEIVKLLLEPRYATDINLADDAGCSPLWVACERGHAEVVKLLLLKKDIDSNQRSKRGVSPLEIACTKGNSRVAELLLNAAEQKRPIVINKEEETEGQKKILAMAKWALQYARQAIRKGSNYPEKVNSEGIAPERYRERGMAREEVRALDKTSAAMKKYAEYLTSEKNILNKIMYVDKYATSFIDFLTQIVNYIIGDKTARLNLESQMAQFYQEAVNTFKKYSLGNCYEFAIEALDCFLKAPGCAGISAEVFHIEGGDHAFLVVNRNPNSDPNDPCTWGEEAVICDPWANKVYLASRYLEELENYVGNIAISSKAGDFSTKIVGVTEKFDSTHHTLQPFLLLNTAFLRGKADVEALKANFAAKGNAMVKMLQNYDNGLEDIYDRLVSEYGTNDAKAQIIAQKRVAIASQITQLNKKIAQTTDQVDDEISAVKNASDLQGDSNHRATDIDSETLDASVKGTLKKAFPQKASNYYQAMDIVDNKIKSIQDASLDEMLKETVQAMQFSQQDQGDLFSPRKNSFGWPSTVERFGLQTQTEKELRTVTEEVNQQITQTRPAR